MLTLETTGFGAPRALTARGRAIRAAGGEPGCCDGGQKPDACCGPGATATRRMFGLGADGSLMQATITQTVAERVAAIRKKMVTIGIPAAIGSGAVTMLTFAGAFGLAGTERVWMPAIWLGAMTTVGALISVALAAKTAEDEAKKQEETATPPVTPTAVTPTEATTPAPPSAFGHYGYGYY